MWILAPKGHEDEGAYAVKDGAEKKLYFFLKNEMIVNDMVYN